MADAPKPNLPFWKKITQNAAPEASAPEQKASLVESIVRQAELQAGKPQGSMPEDPERAFEREERETRRLMSIANSSLAGICIVSIAMWAFFFAVLDEGNSVYGLFDAQNLKTIELEKTALETQLKKDLTETRRFVALMQVENLARQVLTLPVEPLRARVVTPPEISDDDAADITPERETGAVITRHDERITAVHAYVASIEKNVRFPEALATAIEHLMTRVSYLGSTDSSDDQRSAHIQAAQFHAKEILTQIKSENLQAIIADLKNQVRNLDTSRESSETRAVIAELGDIVQRVQHRDPNSIERAIVQTRMLNVTAIDNTAIYQHVMLLIGSGNGQNGDMALAAAIARDLGRMTLIAELDAERISWSQVMDHIQRIASFGADLTPDAGVVYTDSRRDLGATNSDIGFTGFSGKRERNVIEIRGQVKGANEYRSKNFTLLADLIDALEGSVYFKDVTGFTFSNNRDAVGEFFAPIGLKLTLQNPSVADSRDAPVREEATDLSRFSTTN